MLDTRTRKERRERGELISVEARQAVDRARKASVDFAKGQETVWFKSPEFWLKGDKCG